jgi:hypothetical protein
MSPLAEVGCRSGSSSEGFYPRWDLWAPALTGQPSLARGLPGGGRQVKRDTDSPFLPLISTHAVVDV